ncbi:MAG TPA: hypothetical protein VFJ72_07775 [Rubrobacteraceae bacterium]|nr:hypothetical protein [Rubrobacteraceae bacterium]
MNYRELDGTGMRVSEISAGVWTFGSGFSLADLGGGTRRGLAGMMKRLPAVFRREAVEGSAA